MKRLHKTTNQGEWRREGGERGGQDKMIEWGCTRRGEARSVRCRVDGRTRKDSLRAKEWERRRVG